jgi:N-acetylglutamate synthase-like GNAT family acetyltransferase
MAEPVWTFTEKSFYLNEFRGRSLAIALPDVIGAALAPLEACLDELLSNGTRVVLLSPSCESLKSLAGLEVQGLGGESWIGPLWRRLRSHQRVALELPASGFATECRRAALRLRLAKLVWIDPRGALERPDGGRMSVVDLADLEALIDAGAGSDAPIDSSDLVLLREIRILLQGGIPAVNLCSLEGLADELFTYAGSGTFFTRERYAEVRRLALDDFDAAADLIARGVEEGYLVSRSDAEVERILGSGLGVFIEGRYLAGIGCLLPWADGRAGEIASLYTLTRFLGEGVGGHLIRYALECARAAGHEYVFACTTSERVERFFQRQGFRRVEAEDVPPEKWRDYAAHRRSQIRCLRIDLQTGVRSSPRP